MPDAIGVVIDARDGGKPVVNTTAKPVAGSAGGRVEPEIVNGFESPTTERFGTTDSDSGPRLNRHGKPDGRTTRWKRESTGNSTEKKSVRITELSEKFSIEDMIFNVHAMLASFVSVESLAIDKDEAKQLADAINEVNKFYNVGFDPKKVAIFNLVVVAGKIYGTRAVALYMDSKSKAPAEPGPRLVKRETPPPAPEAVRPVSEMSPSDLFKGAMDTSGAI